MIIYDKSNYFLMKIKLSFLTIIFSKIFLYSATQLNSLPKFGYLEKKIGCHLATWKGSVGYLKDGKVGTIA